MGRETGNGTGKGKIDGKGTRKGIADWKWDGEREWEEGIANWKGDGEGVGKGEGKRVQETGKRERKMENGKGTKNSVCLSSLLNVCHSSSMTRFSL